MLRRAWRRLWATPLFTIFAIVSLALGVGVTTAIHSVVLSLTRTGLAPPNAGAVGVIVGSSATESRRPAWRSLMSRADFDELVRGRSTAGATGISAAFVQSVVTASATENVAGEAVSGNYFSILGVQPFRGRLIQPADDDAPARVAVVSHQFWRTRLDRGSIEQSLRIGGQPFQIVGVAPDGMGGLTDRPQSSTAVWVPIGSAGMFPSGAAPPKDAADRRRRQLTVLLALDQAPIDRVSAEVTAIGARLDLAFPLDLRGGPDAAPQKLPRNWSVRSLDAIANEVDSRLARVELIIVVVVALVLVVACTNLANLVLARGSARVHELAVRRALGASRTRVIVEQLAETGLLAAMGAVGAYVVTRALLTWFTAASLPVSEALVVQLDPRLDTSTLLLAALSVLGSLVVFGLAPAVQLSRSSLRLGLSTEGGSTGRLQWQTRRGLISAQVMISVSFFLMAAFTARAVLAEQSRPSGIDLDRLAIGRLNFRLPGWDETRARAAIDGMMSLASQSPGLEAAAIMSGLPFGTNYTPSAEVTTVDRPFLPGKSDHAFAPLLAATPSVFPTLGVSIVRGRAFDARDVAGAPAVAVLSDRTARQLFGSVDVVGREILLRHGYGSIDPATQRTLAVIGVASDTDTQHRYSRDAGAVYLPLAQHPEPLLALVGRAHRGEESSGVVAALRTLAGRVDPDLAIEQPAAAPLVLTGAYAMLGVVSRVTGLLAILAMLLSMAGLFGVLSHLVSRRTRELGLRMALGAQPHQIRRLVMMDGLTPIATGIVMGLLLGLIGRGFLQAAFGSSAAGSDLLLFVLAPIPLVLAGLVASYWPARRASRVDPNVALREL